MARLGLYCFPALGAAFAVAGTDKITGDADYVRMFRHLGWSRGAMRTVAAAEMLGGTMLGPRSTRRLGGLLLAGTSAAVLVSELRRDNLKLAGPRALMLLMAMLAVAARRS